MDFNTTMSLPFTVIGGFLGAGKTTLLNNLLRESEETRFAILVNDFGELNIDETLIMSHDGETISLANGCMCCSMANGFVMALISVMEKADQFDHIVIEASGVSNPQRIIDIATIDPDLIPNGTIVLADASQILNQMEDPLIADVVTTQLERADIIVINKSDLIDNSTLTRVKARLDEINPNGSKIIGTRANVSTTILLGAEKTAASCQASEIVTTHDSHAHVHAEEQFRSVAFQCDGTVNRESFEKWVAALPASVIRGKGVIAFSDSPGYRWVWQKVGPSTALERRDEHSSDTGCKVLLIGTVEMPGTDDLSGVNLFSKISGHLLS